ncbi:MAG: sulfur oxidation c-type cytochrome SoxX [Betaproteobacteria bacterium]|nr:MAG: sulfur oxidation c-type cytochrome SoxX [Betaproteobacteria bacterium]
MRANRVAQSMALVMVACSAERGGVAGDGTGQAALEKVVASSFRARGQAGLDRLQQSEMQRICSRAPTGQLPADLQQRLQREALQSVRFPEDGRWLGKWQQGEKIAQSGTGMQYSDAADAPRGGGCYGCHQLSGTEIAYGTIGPSLYRYLERKGAGSDAMQRAWTQIWNAHAYNACSVMPRFGDAGILTPEQIRDVMALLFDPQSPVNR